MKRTLLALSAVALLAGCGGGGNDSPSKAEFKKDFAPLDTQLKAAGTDMAKVFQGSAQQTDVVLAKQIDAVDRQLNDVVPQIADLTPPDEIKDDYAKLNTILAGLEKDVAGLAAAVRAHDAPGSKSGAQQIIRDSVKVKAVANRVRTAVGIKPTP